MRSAIGRILKTAAYVLALIAAFSIQAPAANWVQVWADEFNGSIGPDWVFETGGGGWGNNELQYYQRANATIENNMLVITAKRESVGGMAYTSTRMKTQGKKSWKYGKIVARIALPAFQGSWPAFWMLGDNIGSVGWPACGELDIMEQINTNNQVWGSTHWYSGGQADFTSSGNTSVTAFHEYSIEWDSQNIKWFIDGVQFNSFYIGGNAGGTNAFNQNNFFLILNMAVGGNWPGNTINNNALPAKMYVDYVRVYQDGVVPPPPPPPPASGSNQFMIVNKYSGKALDLIAGNTANGARINQWTYDYNGANQRFSIQPTEGNAHFKLVSAVSGKVACVKDDSTADGAQLHAWDYVGNNPAQQWDLVDVGNGWFKIRNVKSGKVLDVDAWSTANDAKVHQWTDGGMQDNQLWRLQPQGDYLIQASGGRYICVANAGSANGERIIQWDKGTNPWFKWRFQTKNDGWMGVHNLNALGRVLCVAGGSYNAGQYCHLWDYNTGNIGDQKVRIVPQTDGTFKFYFAHTGMTWDIPGGNAANAVPLEQYPNNGNAWQKFRLERQ